MGKQRDAVICGFLMECFKYGHGDLSVLGDVLEERGFDPVRSYMELSRYAKSLGLEIEQTGDVHSAQGFEIVQS